MRYILISAAAVLALACSGTDAAAPLERGEIVILRSRDLHLVSLSGAPTRRLTSSGKIMQAVPIDSDRLIVQESAGFDSTSCSILDLATGGTDPLFKPPAPEVYGAFAISPDRSRAAFFALRPTRAIMTVDLGSDRTPTTLLEAWWVVNSLGWSRDGKTLLLRRMEKKDEDADKEGIYILTVPRDADRHLSQPDFKQIVRGQPMFPAWSSDDKWIAWWGREDNRAGIFVVGADGKGTRRVADTFVLSHNIYFNEPVWAPDGKSLLYVSTPKDDAGKYRIWTVRPDGAAPVELAGTDEHNVHPAWSPDGRRIAFLRTTGYGSTGPRLAIMNADGTGARVLDEAAEGVVWVR